MIEQLARYKKLGSKLVEYLVACKRLPDRVPTNNPTIDLAENSVKVTFYGGDTAEDTIEVPTGKLCAFADYVGDLLLEVSAPTGTTYTKKQLVITYAAQRRCTGGGATVSATSTIDWTQAGDHDFMIEGRGHADRVLFTAVLTVLVG